MYSFKYLEIKGYKGKPVPHTFIQQDEDSHHVAILLPGMGYTSHMPVLYYPMSIMLAMGADVLRVEYEYHRSEDFMALQGNERKQWLITDTANACQTVLKERPYREITLIGKSLGTRAMGHLLTTEDPLKQARAIWLTPVLRSEGLRLQIEEWGQPSLFVIGTADPHYNQAHLDELRESTGSEMLIIEGADHSLEIGNDPFKSLEVMEKVVRAVQAYTNS